MEIVRLEDYTFFYPHGKNPALDRVNFSVNKGEFVAICGLSGSGKSTLLRSLKPEVAPHGKREGRVLFCGDEKFDSKKIGFVMQNPDNQIVTDTVWHELAFGLENSGMERNEMRIRVGEIATFFGIEKWFHKNTSELSGGQKQILNLASVMVTEPELLILDEPTSRLDPIASADFFAMLSKINAELGTTVIVSEHRTEELFPYIKRVVVMDNGAISADSHPSEIASILKEKNSNMFMAMPAVMRIHQEVDSAGECPVSIAEARGWLDEFIKNKNLPTAVMLERGRNISDETALFVKDIYYRYEKNANYVLKGLSLEVKKGEIYGILGGNGSGKSTLMWLISGGMKLQNGKKRCLGKTAFLPQNPEVLFVRDTLLDDLLDVGDAKAVEKVMQMCGISHLADRHPYDLSGGEQQKAALCKVLLTEPDIILLDEPTKGIDAYFKDELGKLLAHLAENGVTVIMVSHDTEFCAGVCDRCGLLFDGEIISSGETRKFFGGKKFYTTQTARLFRGYADNIILPEDAVEILNTAEDGK